MRGRLAVFLLAALVPCRAATAQGTNSLVGVWRYVGESDSTADGKPVSFMPASGFAGLLIYTRDGRFSAQILPDAPAPGRSLPDLIELSTSYFGTYVVDWARHRVTHRVAGNLVVDAPGAEYHRTFERKGNRLILHGEFVLEGKQVFFAVTWEKVE